MFQRRQEAAPAAGGVGAIHRHPAQRERDVRQADPDQHLVGDGAARRYVRGHSDIPLSLKL